MSRRLKIAMVAACPFPCERGTPIRILRMSQALSDAGVDVHVITYHLGASLHAGRVTIHRIPRQAFYRKTEPGPDYLKLFVLDPLLSVTLYRLHRKHRFDLIHAHHFEGLLAAWPARRLNRTPMIFDSHTLLGSELHHYNLRLPARLKQQLGDKLDRYLPRLADFVICVSEQIRSTMIDQAGIPAEQTALIPNGLELDHFITETSDTRPFDPENPVLGFAGNFAKYQGIDRMLTAVSVLSAVYPGIRLNIYSSDKWADFRDTVNRLGVADRVSVVPTSYQQLPEHLSQVDILLNPRVDGAGTPVKLINYMSAGKPIVTFAGSAHEIIAGETGWVVADDTPEAFADGIVRMLSDEELAKKLGQNARRFVTENFSWQQRAKEILQIYDRLCNPS